MISAGVGKRQNTVPAGALPRSYTYAFSYHFSLTIDISSHMGAYMRAGGDAGRRRH